MFVCLSVEVTELNAAELFVALSFVNLTVQRNGIFSDFSPLHFWTLMILMT